MTRELTADSTTKLLTVVASYVIWEVLPDSNADPIVATGATGNADAARVHVEKVLTDKPHAGLGILARYMLPGTRMTIEERAQWPPIGQEQQCRRTRSGGFRWLPLTCDTGHGTA
jgi:hypothetical protein